MTLYDDSIVDHTYGERENLFRSDRPNGIECSLLRTINLVRLREDVM